jgi:hypothetical protein
LAPTAWSSLSIGTPLKVTGSLYQGVLVVNEIVPTASSIGMSNSALSPLFVLLIRPETVRITLPSGLASGAASAFVAPPAAATVNAMPVSFANPRRVTIFSISVSQLRKHLATTATTPAGHGLPARTLPVPQIGGSAWRYS